LTKEEMIEKMAYGFLETMDYQDLEEYFLNKQRELLESIGEEGIKEEWRKFNCQQDEDEED
jgi:hypothetical protein